MNFAANLLGLDNAATPLGLKAMKELDSLNPHPGTATNSMATFLALNTGGNPVRKRNLLADPQSRRQKSGPFLAAVVFIAFRARMRWGSFQILLDAIAFSVSPVSLYSGGMQS